MLDPMGVVDEDLEKDNVKGRSVALKIKGNCVWHGMESQTKLFKPVKLFVC